MKNKFELPLPSRTLSHLST